MLMEKENRPVKVKGGKLDFMLDFMIDNSMHYQ